LFILYCIYSPKSHWNAANLWHSLRLTHIPLCFAIISAMESGHKKEFAVLTAIPLYNQLLKLSNAINQYFKFSNSSL